MRLVPEAPGCRFGTINLCVPFTFFTLFLYKAKEAVVRNAEPSGPFYDLHFRGQYRRDLVWR